MCQIDYSKEEIEKKIITSLDKLRNHDQYLLTIDAHERSIAHKLAIYLQEEFPELDVDSEYNRRGNITKTIRVPKDNKNWKSLETKSVFPDIIIHERGPKGRNILVIEIKKSTNPDLGDADKAKLQAFGKEPYNYKFGLFLRIGIEEDEDDLEWF